MDDETKVGRWKGALFCFVALIICGIFSFGELNYLFLSRSAQATVTKASEITERSGRFGMQTHTKLSLEYAFVDSDGLARTGHDSVELTWLVPPDKKVAVRYFPGKDGNSRLAGGFGWLWVVAFGIILSACIYFITRFILHVRAETRDDKPRRR